MSSFPTKLDGFVFEIRYGSGLLYFDKCGQTMIDIEQNCEGWIGLPQNQQMTGILQRPDKNYHAAFSNLKFDFSVQPSTGINVDAVIQEIIKLWKIIQANLGLEDILRVGYRVQYLKAAKSVEEAENLLKKSKFNLIFPDNLNNSDFKVRSRKMISSFSIKNIEYRLQMESVTRTSSVDPSNLQVTDPRILSSKQKEHRLAQIRQLNEYSVNPTYAVSLDIDCAQFSPETLSIKNFIADQNKIIDCYFLPIIEEL